MLKSIRAAVATSLFAVSGLYGQFVAALPGTTTSGSSVSAYTASALTLVDTVTAGPNSFSVLAKPDGSKFYIVANSGSNSVTVVDNSFSNPTTVASFGSQATAAAITPDGTKLVVVAGSLQIIDTSTDQTVGTGVNVNSTAYDVAISLDGSTAFVLGQAPTQGSVLTAVDIPSATVKSSINIAGKASGVAVGPNGLAYVSTVNQIVEANYANSTLTQTNVISLNASPTRVTFTSDGRYAAATNETPGTGSSIQLYSLSSHTVANFVPSFGTTLDQIVSTGVNSFIAYSKSAQALFTVTLNPNGNIVPNVLTIAGLPSNSVTAFALSNEVGAAGAAVTGAHYLYVATSTTVYRVDLSSNQLAGQVSPIFSVGALSYAAPALVNGLPATLLPFGGNQPAVAQGTTSLPLVVQVLDATGLPISGSMVSFTASAGSLTTATQTTGSNGYAQTSLAAPAAGGPVTITATVGSLSATFTLQVSGTTGTGGGGSTSGLSFVAGQGQLIEAFTSTGNAGFGSPLEVLATGANGQPAANVPVTFTLTQGDDTLVGGTTSIPGQTVVMTDNNGLASITLLTSVVMDLVDGFDSDIITASAPNTNTLTFYETTTPLATSSSDIAPPTVFPLSPAPGSTLTAAAGSVLKGGFVVRVLSGTGVPVPNVSLIMIDPNNPTGTPAATCVDPTGAGVLSDSTGTITCDLMFSGQLGMSQIQGLVGYTHVTPRVNLQINQGPPGTVTIITGNNQSGSPGQTLPKALLIQVTDGFGNPLVNTPVSFSVTPSGSVTLTNVSTTTDANARASATVTLGNTAGSVTVTVTAGTATAVFNLTIAIPVAGISVSSGNNQTATVSTAFAMPLVVQAVDSNNNPVSGVTVAFAVTSGSATLSAPTAVTMTNGQASVTATAGSTTGNIVVTATAGGFSALFNLAAQPVPPPGPTITAIVNGASFQPGASPGSIVTITGTNLTNSITGVLTPNSIVGGPLPTTLGGVTVTFNGTAAPIFSVSNISGAQQVTVQVPFEVATGQVSVAVSVQNVGSTTAMLTLAQFSPGVFSTTANGQTFAVAVRSDGSYVTAANPAHRGENIVIFLTGLGPTNPAAVTGTEGQGQAVVAPVVTGLNNAGVPLISAVLTPNLVGVYAVTMMVPMNTAPGAAQPVGFIIYDANNNAFFAPSTSIPIE